MRHEPDACLKRLAIHPPNGASAMSNRTTLKLPTRSADSPATGPVRAPGHAPGPGDPIDPAQVPGDPAEPDQGPGDPIGPDHGPGDPAQPVHHVRYPLLKAFWRDVAPPRVVVSTVRRRPRTIESM